jgi:hypothetical protein
VCSMSSAPSNRTTVLCNPFLSNGTVNTSTIICIFCAWSVQIAYKRSEFRCSVSSGQLRVNNSGRSTRTSKQIGTRSTEEYKKPACEDFTCDLKTLCLLQHSEIGSM